MRTPRWAAGVLVGVPGPVVKVGGGVFVGVPGPTVGVELGGDVGVTVGLLVDVGIGVGVTESNSSAPISQ